MDPDHTADEVPGPHFVPLEGYPYRSDVQMLDRARAFSEEMGRRRTVREFSDEPVPREIVEQCIRAAASAPSGANRQPWHFVLVSNPAVKREIRIAAEKEEEDFYSGRAPREWLDALGPLGTDSRKAFLERAPHLIAVFAESHGIAPDGTQQKNYYVRESVGLAAGILIAALHRAGLATLTHTPSPMGFLNRILNRPARERPFLLVPVGRPAADAQVPKAALRKKSFAEICTVLDRESS
ncbi:MAG: nitroreductase family protein [Gemmatimonadota bacterium]